MNQLLHTLRTIRFWRNFERPFAAGAALCWLPLLLTAAAMAGLTFDPVLFLWTGYGGTAAGVLAACLGFLNRNTLREAAARVDRELPGSANRLEAAVQLAEEPRNPLREAQLESAEAFWRSAGSRPLPRLLWRPWLWCALWLAGVVAVPILTGDFHVRMSDRIAAQQRSTQSAADPEKEPEEDGGKEENEKEPPKPPVRAELVFTYPEKDPGYKPVDLVEWEGKGSTNSEFRTLTLAITRNGEAQPEVPVDLSGVKSENGVIFASGAFALDEYGAEPFDMVGIRLNGVLKEGQRISSAPIFFRVKELREEIGVVDCPGGGYTEKYNFIAAFLRQQIRLNELFYVGCNSLSLDPEADLEAFGMLADEQLKLRQELADFVAKERDDDKTDTPLSPEMIQSLSAAGQQMLAAEQQIRKIPAPPAPKLAGEAQQKAVYHLSRALRQFRKVININPHKKPSGQSDSDRKKEPNPGELLKKAIGIEENVVKHSGPGVDELPAELGQQQSGVTWILKMLAARTELPAAMAEYVTLALPPSLKAEEAIASNAAAALKVHAEQALDQMRAALARLKRHSDGDTDQALGKARGEVRQAQSKMAGSGKSSGKAAAARHVEAARRQLEEAKNSEQHNGLKENADKLGKLAESAAAAAKELTKLPDAEAAARLDGLMRELGRAQRELRGKTDTPDALAAELDGLKREMGYHQKRGDWKQAEAWRNDLLLALEAGMGYWREQKQSPRRTLALNESMPLQGAVRDMQLDREPPEPELKRIAAALDKLAELLERNAAEGEPPNAVYQFSPDRIPEEYRDAAARYFEALSRMRGKPAKPNDREETK
ncbi:hypothetical protein [Victivallis vadensis]|uniref:hypothetical protein n=1 Tax=Victivallis vadensis TaxID=172901 RepID=UPI00266C965E|nr:hypothetical protein [Victivallis vadensis]